MSLPLVILAASLTALTPWTSGVAPSEPGGSDAFARASIVPPDASVYLRAVDGRSLRRELSSRPIGAAMAATVLDDAMVGAWRTLARDVRCDEGELFDRLFGRDVTLAIRWSPTGPDWALVSAVDAEEIDRLLAPRGRDRFGRPADGPRLGAALGISILGGGWRELARQQVVAWHRDGMLVVAPAAGRALADEIVALLGAVGGPRLGNDAALAEARGLGGQGPRVEIFARSTAPTGQPDGWTAAVAELRGGVVELRRRSSVTTADEPGGAWPSDTTAWPVRGGASVAGDLDDPAAGDAIDRLRDGGVVAFVEPLDDQDHASAAIATLAPDLFGAHGAELRLLRALADGPTTVIVASRSPGGSSTVEAAPGRTAPAKDQRSDTEPPGASVALVTEILNPMDAERLQEQRLRGRAEASSAGAASIGAVAGDFPGATATVSEEDAAPLYMQIIATERGRWKVVSNDPALLGRVVHELHASGATGPRAATIAIRPRSPVRGIGMLDGRSLAAQMRALQGPTNVVPSIDRIAAPATTDDTLIVPRDEPAGRIGEWVADWASAIETMRWVLRQPQPDRIDLRATIHLAAPASMAGR